MGTADRPLLGAHVHAEDLAAHAAQVGAEVVQFFLADPQGWKTPLGLKEPHPQAGALAAAGVAVYVHAPYIVNVASPNNRIRIPSRKLLAQHAQAAANLGARGLIVHGGHVGATDDPRDGVENWRKTFARASADTGGFPLPILLENTAGGTAAMARRFDRLAMLWDAIGPYGPGFCLDTCHAHAGGEDLDRIVERVRAITGRVDLVHANDSRDAFDSGADRHATFGTGQIDPAAIVAVARDAGCDVVVETPAAGQADDLAFLREQLVAV